MATNSKDTFTERNPYLVYSDEFEDTKTDIMKTVGIMLEDTAITLSSEAVRAFDTVTEMQACTSLMVGMICHTNGFHEAGDGGAAFYKVTASGTANGMDVLACGDVFANLVITESYVTPEMFGAVGDGVHDDTAVLTHVLSNYHRILFNSTGNYACHDLAVISNQIIDFNGCKMTVNGTTLFKINCQFDKELYTGAYTAYAVSGFSTGAGLVYVTSTELVHPGRNYYYGGFVAYSDDDSLNISAPYSLDSCTMYGQTNEIKNVVFKNLSGINYQTGVSFTGNNVVFDITGVSDFVFDNVNFDTPFYAGIFVYKSQNVTIENSNINVKTAGKSFNYINTYNIGFLSGSTKCTVRNCSMYSDYWHCISTGGHETNIDITVENCILSSSRSSQYIAYQDHGNTINTTIKNCIVGAGIGIADGTIENCTLMPTKGRTVNPVISLVGFVGTKYHSSFVLNDIRANSNNFPISISQDAEQGSNDLEIKSIYISNIHGNNLLNFDLQTPSNYVAHYKIKKLCIENCDGPIAASMAIISEETTINNCTIDYLYLQKSAWYSLFNSTRKLTLNNCKSSRLLSTYSDFNWDILHIDGCTFSNTGNEYLQVSKECIVKNSSFRGQIIASAFIQSCRIYFESFTGNIYAFYKDANATDYYRKLRFYSNVEHIT